jgi:hypothetical protein
MQLSFECSKRSAAEVAEHEFGYEGSAAGFI